MARSATSWEPVSSDGRDRLRCRQARRVFGVEPSRRCGRRASRLAAAALFPARFAAPLAPPGRIAATSPHESPPCHALRAPSQPAAASALRGPEPIATGQAGTGRHVARRVPRHAVAPPRSGVWAAVTARRAAVRIGRSRTEAARRASGRRSAAAGAAITGASTRSQRRAHGPRATSPRTPTVRPVVVPAKRPPARCWRIAGHPISASCRTWSASTSGLG